MLKIRTRIGVFFEKSKERRCEDMGRWALGWEEEEGGKGI